MKFTQRVTIQANLLHQTHQLRGRASDAKASSSARRFGFPFELVFFFF